MENIQEDKNKNFSETLTSLCKVGHERYSNLSNIEPLADLHIIFLGESGFSKPFHCTGCASNRQHLEQYTCALFLGQGYLFTLISIFRQLFSFVFAFIVLGRVCRCSFDTSF